MNLTLRELVAIAVAFLVGVGFSITTAMHLREQRSSHVKTNLWRWLDTYARLLFGVGLALLAVWTLMGHTVWQSGQGNETPAWAAPVGLALILICGISAIVMVGRALWQRVQPGQR